MSRSPMRSPGVSGVSSSLSEYSRVDSTPGEWPAVMEGNGVGGLNWPTTAPVVICVRGEGTSSGTILIGDDGWTVETTLGRPVGDVDT